MQKFHKTREVFEEIAHCSSNDAHVQERDRSFGTCQGLELCMRGTSLRVLRPLCSMNPRSRKPHHLHIDYRLLSDYVR